MTTYNEISKAAYFLLLGVLISYLVTLHSPGAGSDIVASTPRPAPIIKVFDVSAYCPKECCCGQFADGITASGHKIQPGDSFCAAPPEYPFGTMIDIPGYGCVPVLDRGGSIKSDKLDVFFPDHQRALQWGRQKLICTFKETNDGNQVR